MPNKKNIIKDYIRKNKNREDWSGDAGINDTIKGNYLNIDLSGACGKKITIKSDLTFLVDMSGSDFDEVELSGFFTTVDVSEARIGTLITKDAEIIFLSNWRAKIGKRI